MKNPLFTHKTTHRIKLTDLTWKNDWYYCVNLTVSKLLFGVGSN